MATPQPPHPPQHLLTDPLYLLSLSSETSLLLASLASGPPHLAVGPLSSLLLTLNVRLSDLSNDLTLNSTLEKEKATQIMDELLGPFLQVVIDETAQGPQTLQALQSLTNIVTKFPPESSSVQKILTQALQCRYEQTDEVNNKLAAKPLNSLSSILISHTLATLVAHCSCREKTRPSKWHYPRSSSP